MNPLLTTLSALCFAGPVHADTEKPNIVIILTDDQGYADISFNPDHPREVDTPHMDALAKEGVFFSVPGGTGFDGKSLLPLLTGTAGKHHETLYWNSGEPKGEWAVRQGSWKAHGFKKSYELYDLAIDPSETNDISGEHPEIAKKLADLHSAWHAEMKKSAGAAPEGKKMTEEEMREKKREQRKRERQEAKKKTGKPAAQNP